MAVAHLNGYPAYRLPCHVSLRQFLGLGSPSMNTHHTSSIWQNYLILHETGPPFGGEWVQNYLSPAADTQAVSLPSVLGFGVGAIDNADFGLVGLSGRMAAAGPPLILIAPTCWFAPTMGAQ